jgi:hypothetical protein
MAANLLSGDDRAAADILSAALFIAASAGLACLVVILVRASSDAPQHLQSGMTATL